MCVLVVSVAIFQQENKPVSQTIDLHMMCNLCKMSHVQEDCVEMIEIFKIFKGDMQRYITKFMKSSF